MGNNPNTAVIRPSFFKPLMNDYSTKLRLPFVFVKKHRKFLPENAMLRIRTGKIWNMKIEEYYEDGEGLCFFTEGWSDFVRDLELQNMQMLVFSLNVDKAAFNVTVYEENSNEKGILHR
ncbi:hypothetical protein C2S53_004169 [Perilla frutescens var. hirtella]|uniref:TF-B3 domain-containing protein n=1 Tax=Perilla frutescens var. hirtella TaxID=608512 RepID=A0AAD4JIE4_PERFH|nr:hypothetical protein C2S53_004169 [Perilla frutescens var. hirtella]